MIFSKDTKELRWYSDKGSVGNYSDEIRPMLSVLPEWYKQTQRWVEDAGLQPNPYPGVKNCLPFLDGLTSGYALVLTEDIFVEQTPDGPVVRFAVPRKFPPVQNRPPHATDPMPVPLGYSKEHFLWVKQVAVEAPDGYSILYTHPLNRFDLPFLTVSAIVDDYPMPGANISFFLKEGFEGVISAGTPVAQLIPFKREDWKAVKDKKMYERSNENIKSTETLLGGYYRKNFWRKKSFK